MPDDRTIIDGLHKYGYLPDVPSFDLRLLTLQDRIVQEAMQKYQDFCFYPLDSLARRHHGRALAADGEVGPATRELFTMPRCDVPDFGPGSGRELTGAGSWPQPCQKQGVKIHFDWSNAPAAVKDKAPEHEATLIELWRLVGERLVKVQSAADANIYVYFGWFVGSTIGMAGFNGGSCGDRVSCKLSSSYVWGDIGLLKHETGHNNNFGHTRGGTMNPFILKEADPQGRWLKTDPSWRRCVEFFDGVPVGGPGPAPGPDPPPPAPDEPTYGPIIRFFLWLIGK